MVTSEFGPEARETATALNNLALTYQLLARYTEAEPLNRRAIEIDEKIFGKDHPDVATRYNNLGMLLKDQRKYAAAEPLYRRAIEIGERFSARIIDVPTTSSGFRRSIEISEKVLGKDHPTVAIRYDNLAGLLQDQRKYDQAEPLLRRAFEIDEKASRQGSSQRCNPLQQSRLIASGPGQV